MSKYPPEPWCRSETISGGNLPARTIILQADEHGRPVMEPPIADCGIATGTAEAIADRIVAAVNCCEGLPTEELAPGMLLADAERNIRLVETKKELLAACEHLLAIAENFSYDRPNSTGHVLSTYDAARAAIAKATGT